MTLKAILARDDRYGIGKNGGLPWAHNKEDMNWFRDNTIGDIVVMGANTWNSIGNKKLEGRKNIVLRSGNNSDPLKGNPDDVYSGPMQLVLQVMQSDHPNSTIWIIGGGQIYQEALPYCSELYETHVLGDFNCDIVVDPILLHRFRPVQTIEKPGLIFTVARK